MGLSKKRHGPDLNGDTLTRRKIITIHLLREQAPWYFFGSSRLAQYRVVPPWRDVVQVATKGRSSFMYATVA